ncbi:hypothetical protein EAO71_26090 [Streptomyces sp. ms191]|nr:hypothetical protein EAO71_26090 [Streptomyces sp. ms191]
MIRSVPHLTDDGTHRDVDAGRGADGDHGFVDGDSARRKAGDAYRTGSRLLLPACAVSAPPEGEAGPRSALRRPSTAR